MLYSKYTSFSLNLIRYGHISGYIVSLICFLGGVAYNSYLAKEDKFDTPIECPTYFVESG
jgi:hypothetical protein